MSKEWPRPINREDYGLSEPYFLRTVEMCEFGFSASGVDADYSINAPFNAALRERMEHDA